MSLLSTIYKLYAGILNNRLVTYLEDNNIYAEEQNGFRQNRSCAEHVFTLTILRNRQSKGESTYVAYLDAEKACDRVDRNLLLYKLLINGIYDLNLGVKICNKKLSILLYADNIVLLSDTENGLQAMLNAVHKWGQKFMIKFTLPVVNQYKYLSVILNEFVNFNVTADILSGAANRALGAIIGNYKHINGLGYYTYTKLYNSGVCQILDYCSEVWGFKQFKQIEAIQHKAIRIFLGVHRYAPLPAIEGDMGWSSCDNRRKVAMFRY